MTKLLSRIVATLLMAGAFTAPLMAARTPNTNLAQFPYQSQKLKGKNALAVDKNGNVQLYNGSVYFQAQSSTPTVTSGTFQGVKSPFWNVGPALTAGDVVVTSNTGTGYGTKSTTTASTSVIGIAEGSIATGTLGYVTVGGYAVVHTTGAVAIGDVLVSSASTSGYAGTNNSPATATNLGVALSSGTAVGDSVLIRLR